VAICLERGADLHMAQLMPLPLTVSCFSKIQIGFTFLVPAHWVVPEKGLLNGCVCVHMSFGNSIVAHNFLHATALVRCMNLTMNMWTATSRACGSYIHWFFALWFSWETAFEIEADWVY